ncbi:hypothetical protein ASPZODRAFT_158330 [Penicilliopsis zonata CBS 506.65]|uniref:ML-like domain-containing protein n=1 Tax=Penicilliopsis zonata CBS 506.65 TaxID=1073090 RepID=A0A1L9SN65_9EURO|nr:hypothetical protein ASPZODRAFT_158330 [Penicilliopsis zonata CBS 506.65]OJJ48665.1 hypothetical protein ASPZODRAFT_158330 [Penicilliopsis zonata CBS 506.65]
MAMSIQLIESTSLIQCQENSNLSVTMFNVLFTPSNHTLTFGFDGYSSISGNITLDVELMVYGYSAMKESLDPCKLRMAGLCPMNAGAIHLLGANIQVSEDVTKRIPEIAYSIPDLDALVRFHVNSTQTHQSVGCAEAYLSTGKTVYQVGVAWTLAIITGLGFLTSAATSLLGYTNAAAHMAWSSLSFLAFMQSQAMLGMSSVHMPPIAQSWTQNFQWSMGIIHRRFLGKICSWYQRATGGTPSDVLSRLSTVSVIAQKRSLEPVTETVWKRAMVDIPNTSQVVVRGIERVGFRASIESTNIFLTGYIVYFSLVALIILSVVLLRLASKLLAKSRYPCFCSTADWKSLNRGILFRLVLMGYPQMCVFCPWEWTRRDSASEVALASTMWLSMTFLLAWAAWKIILQARKSISIHDSPTCILYSDPAFLNRWGFLYVHFRASAYYFLVPLLLYYLIKGMIIGLVQSAPIVQISMLLVVEAIMLLGISIIRPYMDKGTNAYCISIAMINFINAVFMLIFAGVFKQPGLMTAIMGVAFFAYNAIFCLVLSILILTQTFDAMTSNNPDTRYQPIADDRASFFPGERKNISTELAALGAVARGDHEENEDLLVHNGDNTRTHEEANGSVSSGHSSERLDVLPPLHSFSPFQSSVALSVPLIPAAHQPKD